MHNIIAWFRYHINNTTAWFRYHLFPRYKITISGEDFDKQSLICRSIRKLSPKHIKVKLEDYRPFEVRTVKELNWTVERI